MKTITQREARLLRTRVRSFAKQLEDLNAAVIGQQVIISDLRAELQRRGDKITVLEHVLEKARKAPHRRRLPDTRLGVTHKFDIVGCEGYITVGLFDDFTVGELFVEIQKEGSTIGGLMDAIGILTSVALQHGVPLADLVRKFTLQRFEPAGITTNPEIPMAESVVDYIFRWLELRFIKGHAATVKQLPAWGSYLAL